MSHHSWNYQDALRTQGYRVTPQRELLMDLICAAPARPSAQELVAAAQARGASMDAATVYRNLKFLTERGLLRAIDQGGVARFELGGPHAGHHHLICRTCGREVEVAGEETEALFAALAARTGFRVTSDHLVLEGVCPACAADEPA
jgi:Fur family ferric uptake transcriptional regulator